MRTFALAVATLMLFVAGTANAALLMHTVAGVITSVDPAITSVRVGDSWTALLFRDTESPDLSPSGEILVQRLNSGNMAIGELVDIDIGLFQQPLYWRDTSTNHLEFNLVQVSSLQRIDEYFVHTITIDLSAFRSPHMNILLYPAGGGGQIYIDGSVANYVTANVVPIPPAVWLFGSALGLMGVMRRKGASSPPGHVVERDIVRTRNSADSQED